jgi:hypothetical protein
MTQDQNNDADVQEPTREELWERCAEIGSSEDILSKVDGAVRQLCFAGSTEVTRLVYLAVQSRLFERPVSAAVVAQSSAGKSATIKAALELHPPEAYFVMTSMSEKALIYLEESLKHRMLVAYEVDGLSNDFMAMGIRTLLSEGRLDYWYTKLLEQARRADREGGSYRPYHYEHARHRAAACDPAGHADGQRRPWPDPGHPACGSRGGP